MGKWKLVVVSLAPKMCQLPFVRTRSDHDAKFNLPLQYVPPAPDADVCALLGR